PRKMEYRVDREASQCNQSSDGDSDLPHAWQTLQATQRKLITDSRRRQALSRPNQILARDNGLPLKFESPFRSDAVLARCWNAAEDSRRAQPAISRLGASTGSTLPSAASVVQRSCWPG